VLAGLRVAVRHGGLVLGVDGGGTHTAALLARIEGGGVRSLARGAAGCSNRKAVGSATAFAEIDRAVAAAFEAATLPRGPVVAACLGLAGAGRPDDQAAVRAWAERQQIADRVQVVGDVELPVALLPEGWGIAVVAGTGSCVWGRHAEGHTSRAGGWGPLLGDEGSGYALAVEGLRLVCRHGDRRGRATTLTERLFDRMGASEPADLVRLVYCGDWDRARIAALAADVIRAADDGDTAASDLVEWQAGELADAVAAVASGLGMERSGLPLALAGGLMVNAPTYRDRFLRQLRARGIAPGHVVAVSEPAEGAVRLAAALAIK
jgi:N-acetylmuramic acid 6-phosphate etherase